MNIRTLLELLEQVEQKMDDFYVWCAQEFRGELDAEALFHRLSMEEKAHKNLIQYQKRMARQNPDAYQDVNVTASRVTKCVDQVAFFQQKKAKSTLKETIEFAIEVESDAAESHMPDLIAQSNPSLTNLMKGLKMGDEHHIGLLKDFAKHRGF